MGTIFLDSIYMCQYTIFIFPDSSSGKESTCIAEEASLIPGLGRSTEEGIGYPLQYYCGSTDKEFTCNAGDPDSIPGLRRSPGKGRGFLLQYSGLENSRDCIIHGVAESDMTE